MTINERIAAIRAKMKEQNLTAYLMPSSDPHQSEYVADYWKSREWVSGFTGSAGLVVILQKESALWTDSRYTLQGATQLEGSEMNLKVTGVAHAPEYIDWLKSELKHGDTIGLDGKLFSVGQVRNLAKSFYENGIDLKTDIDLVETVWTDRPTLPTEPIFAHAAKFAGLNRVEKLAKIRERMQASKVNNYLISTLDDIAWTFNLRGSDVASNPVFYAYAIIEKDVAHLFVKKTKIDADLFQKLKTDGVELHDYDSIEIFLKNLTDNILIDNASTSNQVYNSIEKGLIVKGKNIVQPLKAIKNKTEIRHIKNAMRKDGLALTKLFMWLEQTLETRSIPEVEVAEKLKGFRSEQEHYYGESFDAIVGYNGNGAIVHYRAEAATCANIEKNGILLLDSGGQYHDGTTDITRTIALGKPTAEQKRNYTSVLKGHIALDMAKFPHGTTGPQLDTLARMFLWQDCLNYGHGTGHGVGFFLNVHEPPQGFATNPTTSRGRTAIVPGMFTSNEPGFYKANEYGIRIENLVICREGEKNDFGQFYYLENLTLFPIDTTLIDKSRMNTKEIQWLNAYHQEVFEKLSPFLNEEETAWMKKKCEMI
jgi:Xaa-Pro aminopeptidase